MTYLSMDRFLLWKGKIQIGVSIIRSFRANLNYIRIDMVKRWGKNGPTFEKKNHY